MFYINSAVISTDTGSLWDDHMQLFLPHFSSCRHHWLFMMFWQINKTFPKLDIIFFLDAVILYMYVVVLCPDSQSDFLSCNWKALQCLKSGNLYFLRIKKKEKNSLCLLLSLYNIMYEVIFQRLFCILITCTCKQKCIESIIRKWIDSCW